MKKRILSGLLAATLVIASLAGCTAKEEPSGASSDKAPSETASTDTGASTGATTEKDTSPITLTAFMNHINELEGWKWGDDAVSQEITKKTGVSLEITSASTTDNTEFNTMLAAGVDLPDFLVASTDGAIRNMIVSQGFAQPLNKLADEYCPEFWEVLPTDEDKVYQEADGNLYLLTDFFYDSAVTDIKLVQNLDFSFAVDQKIYNEMGRPDISTIDLFIEHLKAVKAKYPQITTPLFEHDPPMGLVNVFNRMYGASSAALTANGDTVSINQKTPAYKDTLKLYNRFYKEGLINPETFTFKTEQKKALLQGGEVYCHAGKVWTAEFYNGDPTTETYEGILTPMPEGRKLEDMTLPTSKGGIGGWHATFISSECKDPKRAIEYLTFMMSDEGQKLQRHGVEGLTWEADEFGMPKDNATKKAAEAAGDSSLEKKYGVYNYNFAWLTGDAIVGQAAHNTYAAYPAVKKDFETNSKYTVNERIYNLAITLTNEDDRVLQKQIKEITTKGVSATVLSKSDAEFESSYSKLMADLNTSGIDKLEKAYQTNYTDWKAKGIK